MEMKYQTSYGSIVAKAERRPRQRQPQTMDPRTWFKDLTPYFIYLLLVSTIGPLLFGYHLVCIYRVDAGLHDS